MKIIDPGHSYELAVLDGTEPQRLVFVKRNTPPEKYPGNTNAYPGTVVQEVVRALLDRMRYVNNQIQSRDNELVVAALRTILYALEHRAAAARNVELLVPAHEIELAPVCSICLHVQCNRHDVQAE